MKPAPFKLLRPLSLIEALEATARAQGSIKFIAGGQTLGPMMNLRLVQPDVLVDLSGLAELRQSQEEDGAVVLGSGVTHAMIEDNKVPDGSGGLMPKVAQSLAYRSVRNRGTLGGSLAHADPTAEWPTVLSALGSEVVLRDANGRRSVPLHEFLRGAMTTTLADTEVIESIRVRRLNSSGKWGFRKICRKVGEFAQALAVVVLSTPSSARAVLGALSRGPFILSSASRVLETCEGWTGAFEDELCEAARRDLSAAGFAIDPYETELHLAALKHAARQALAR